MCFGVGNIEIAPLYAILYYIANFPNEFVEVPIWKNYVIGKMAQWHLLLAEFYITKVIQKLVKGQAFANHLVENPIDGYQPMIDLFPDEPILNIEIEEDHSNWRMYFDEAVNIHGNGIEAIPISPTGAQYAVGIKLRCLYTNNIPKYEGYITGLEATLDMNAKDLEVYGDSILIISQSTKEWGVKSPELAKNKGYLTRIFEAFRLVSFNYLPRSDLEVYGDSILIISQSKKERGVKSPELAKHKDYLTRISEAFHLVSFNYLPRSKNSQMPCNLILHD